MFDEERGVDRAGRRSKRFLTPLEQVRDLAAAGPPGDDDRPRRPTVSGGPVDHHADPHGRQGRRVGGVGGVPARGESPGTRRGIGGGRRPKWPGWPRRSRRWPSSSCWSREKTAGAEWPGPAPRRRGHQGGAARSARGSRSTAGWTLRRACHVLELPEVRAYRWLGRRAAGTLADRRPGRARCTACSTTRSPRSSPCSTSGARSTARHRKLAHRGLLPARVWVSPSSVRRVLAAQGLRLRPPPRPGRSVRKPFPDWVEYRPNQIWIYDTTHFTAARMAVTVVEDLVSRKWIATIVSAEETSTQVQLVFTDALDAEGLLELIGPARTGGSTRPSTTRPARCCSPSPTTGRR